MKKKGWKALFLAMCMLVSTSLTVAVNAEEKTDENLDSSMEVGTQILFENGIHYIVDPTYPDKKITLFCMNNELHWPHHTENMSDMQVPGYRDGYLTPDDFNSQDDYDECMRRLSKLLYAGYPYNGERLYKIVDDSSNYAPTEEDFNDMLIVPAVLQTTYPFLGHHEFTYADYTTQNKEHLEYLRKFTGEVIKLNVNGGTTSNGLTFEDISSMPFYKAAFSITNCNNQTPLEAFQYFYGTSYFVTEEEAYNATQNAVWHLLHEYGIPNNNINNLNTPLATVLDVYSQRGGLLNYKPSADEIEIQGDLRFTYNPKDAMWHSSPLKIIEPEEYRGIYKLELPEGVTAQCDNLNYVYGNEEYELVSDHQPTLGESFGIRAEFVWLNEFKQYSPTPDIEFKGKKFQHMIGAVIENETLYISKPMESKNIGSLSISKSLVGEENSQTNFEFELKLPYNKKINGLYGDLEFTNGVSYFTLKDGETKTATNLPANAYYVVKESKTDGYKVGSTNEKGKIPVADTQLVTFTNTRLPDLSLAKIVTGTDGNLNKKFTFDIELKDNQGKMINGEYQYIGSVYQGHENETNKPDDGKLEFINGKAQIKLSHGQMITIKDVPYVCSYKILEVEANKDGYDTSYDKGEEPATGQLANDYTVMVENHKDIIPLPLLGNIKIDKNVTGTDGDIDKDFTFTIELSDNTINGTYGDVSFKDGIGIFSLKHQESKTITDLPVGIKYTIKESDNDGYTVTSTGDVGEVKANETALVHFENHKDKEPITTLTVKKTWKLDNGRKPTDFIEVMLMQDGKEYKTVKLNEENNWEYTWNDLSINHQYSVKEINVPKGFTSSMKQEGTVITIMNDDEPESFIIPNTSTNSDKPNGNDKNPETGDQTNIGFYTSLFVTAGLGLMVLLVIRKKQTLKNK